MKPQNERLLRDLILYGAISLIWSVALVQATHHLSNWRGFVEVRQEFANNILKDSSFDLDGGASGVTMGAPVVTPDPPTVSNNAFLNDKRGRCSGDISRECSEDWECGNNETCSPPPIDEVLP